MIKLEIDTTLTEYEQRLFSSFIMDWVMEEGRHQFSYHTLKADFTPRFVRSVCRQVVEEQKVNQHTDKVVPKQRRVDIDFARGYEYSLDDLIGMLPDDHKAVSEYENMTQRVKDQKILLWCYRSAAIIFAVTWMLMF